MAIYPKNGVSTEAWSIISATLVYQARYKSTLALCSSSGGEGGQGGGSEHCKVVPPSRRKRDESGNLKLSGADEGTGHEREASRITSTM